jgi:hypothetical protein
MADDTTTADEAATAPTQESTTTPDELGDAGRRALQEERRARRVAEKELEKLRAASMSETEKAVAAAKAEGASEAAKAVGPRIVRAEFRAAAAGQVDRQTLDAYLEDVDLTKFLTNDGEPDTKAIEARIKRLGGGRAADFDGGARTSAASPTDMNSLIRRAAGLG